MLDRGAGGALKTHERFARALLVFIVRQWVRH